MSTPSVPYIVDLTEANFPEVIGRSREVPVLVDFWADWCAPCRQLGPVVEKLAREFKGRFILAKVNADREPLVNADREPLVTQQFGVRGLPTLKLVWQGQLAGELVGAHPESAIRKLLQPFLDEAGVPGEEEGVPDFHAQVMAALQAGHVEDAIAALTAQLDADKEDHRSRTLLVEVLLQENRLDEAQAVVDAAPASAAAQMKRPRALLSFARRTEAVPSLAELDSRIASGDTQTEVLFHHALRLVTANRIEEGLERLLDILRRDREYGEDAARKALLEVFELLGREDPLTGQFRRRMANYLL